jgi:hypothetical protein
MATGNQKGAVASNPTALVEIADEIISRQVKRNVFSQSKESGQTKTDG